MLNIGNRVEIPAYVARRTGVRFGEVIARPTRGGRPVMLGTWFVRLDGGEVMGFGVDALRPVTDVNALDSLRSLVTA